jgi:hypothetical protein
MTTNAETTLSRTRRLKVQLNQIPDMEKVIENCRQTLDLYNNRFHVKRVTVEEDELPSTEEREMNAAELFDWAIEMIGDYFEFI